MTPTRPLALALLVIFTSSAAACATWQAPAAPAPAPRAAMAAPVGAVRMDSASSSTRASIDLGLKSTPDVSAPRGRLLSIGLVAVGGILGAMTLIRR